jgi:hypothetical protein
LLVSGAAVEGFGATGEGAGVGIEGETGAADGENAGVVTGSSPVEADERECLVLVVAEACRRAVTVVAAGAGAVEGAGVAEAPVCIG